MVEGGKREYEDEINEWMSMKFLFGGGMFGRLGIFGGRWWGGGFLGWSGCMLFMLIRLLIGFCKGGRFGG